MTKILIIIISSILTNNFVLCRFLGICPFLGVSKQIKTASGMSFAVIFVMVISTAVTWPIYTHLLLPNDLEFMQTIVFILIIAILVQVIEMAMKKFFPPLYESLGIYLPLITTNCAVLGVTILNVSEKYTFWQSVFNSFGSGVGFFIAIVMFAGVRSKIEKSDIPKSLRGLPITLIAASIMALSMLGFVGLAEGIFGKI